MNTNNPNKSCLNCPSLLPADSTFFGKAIGVQVCSRFGKPLGRVTSSPKEKDQLAKHFAKNCSDYGEPKPGAPDWEKAKFAVTLPDPNVIGAPQKDADLVRSCAGCERFVNESTVLNELGWGAGLCSAKGKLVLANRYSLEARHCDVRSFGSVRQDATGLTYLPEFENNFAGSGDPTKAYMKAKANFVDPRDKETDKTVTPADEAQGIRAWGAVTDPATDNTVYYPIFRRDFFSEEERKLIPTTGDDEHPEDYVDHGFYIYKVIVLWMELDETPAFWGKAGTGKTEFFRHMAYLMQVPFYRFSVTGSTEVDDLAGKMGYTEGVGTHFDKGRFTKAWESVCVIVVDEYNLGQPEVQQYLRPCIDNSKQLVLDQAPDSPIVDRNDFCFVGVAMNPAWDILNVGANTIGDADANRLMHLFIELPPPELEKEIITTRCKHDGFEITKEQLDFVMAVAEDIRKLTDNSTLPISWGIRPQLKAARALRWFDSLTAYKMASADYLEPEQQKILLDIVRTHDDPLF